MKKSALLLLTSLLTACSSVDNALTDTFRIVGVQDSDANKLSAQLRSPQLTTIDLINLPFQLASLDSTNRVDITEQSPIVNFPEGNSFVAALQLPVSINKFTFNLDSLIGRSVFVPSILFLDENLQEISRIDEVAYIDRKGFVIKKQFDTDIAPTIRYIVIFSKDSHFDGKTEIFDMVRAYEEELKGKELSIYSQPKPYAHHSPIGHINIDFSDVFLSATPGLIKESKEVVMVTETANILTDTESFYLQQINKAIDAGDLNRAKSLTEEAIRAGSTKALPYYLEQLEKQK